MILGFHEFWDKKKTQPTNFREKIWAGVGVTRFEHDGQKYITDINKVNKELEFKGEPVWKFGAGKLHTLRLDLHDRWKADMSIQMVYRGPKYSIKDHFNKGITELEKCKSTQKIEILWAGSKIRVPVTIIDGKPYPGRSDIVTQIAINDGFADRHAFFNYFNKNFIGKIIHWTDLRY